MPDWAVYSLAGLALLSFLMRAGDSVRQRVMSLGIFTAMFAIPFGTLAVVAAYPWIILVAFVAFLLFGLTWRSGFLWGAFFVGALIAEAFIGVLWVAPGFAILWLCSRYGHHMKLPDEKHGGSRSVSG